jgi:azurin
LEKNGTMRLFIDDKQTGTAKASGLFANDVQVPVRVGTETQNGNNKIGVYPDSAFILRSNLKVKLETLDGPVTAIKEVVKIDKVITINVVKNVMKYDKAVITAKAGTTIKIILNNPDYMQHNLVIINKGTLEKVGAAADLLARTGDGAKVSYVPKVPEVLAATPLIDPNGKYTMTFKVPDVPGNYPYICTFPGHWRIMKGILKVTK